MSKITRVVVVSDLHCGHAVGLTHHRYQWPVTEHENGDLTKRSKFAKIQQACWRAYAKALAALAPIDRAICVGDAIEGRGERSGGTELITTDREVQADMAVAALDEIRRHAANGYRLTGVYGTTSHCGSDGEDYENLVERRAGMVHLGAHDWPSVNGLVFDVKHHIGSSSIPHGRATATLREMLWNELWAVNKHQPRADVLVRGHCHYAQGVWTPDMDGRDRWGFTLPALQAIGSRYGSRMCSGIVHWGFMHFDVSSKGELVDWRAHITTIEEQVAKAREF